MSVSLLSWTQPLLQMLKAIIEKEPFFEVTYNLNGVTSAAVKRWSTSASASGWKIMSDLKDFRTSHFLRYFSGSSPSTTLPTRLVTALASDAIQRPDSALPTVRFFSTFQGKNYLKGNISESLGWDKMKHLLASAKTYRRCNIPLMPLWIDTIGPVVLFLSWLYVKRPVFAKF